MTQPAETVRADRAVWRYAAAAYLTFWLMVLVLCGGASMLLHAPPPAMRLLSNLCAWSPTFVLWAMLPPAAPGLHAGSVLPGPFPGSSLPPPVRAVRRRHRRREPAGRGAVRGGGGYSSPVLLFRRGVLAGRVRPALPHLRAAGRGVWMAGLSAGRAEPAVHVPPLQSHSGGRLGILAHGAVVRGLGLHRPCPDPLRRGQRGGDDLSGGDDERCAGAAAQSALRRRDPLRFQLCVLLPAGRAGILRLPVRRLSPDRRRFSARPYIVRRGMTACQKKNPAPAERSAGAGSFCAHLRLGMISSQ